MFGLKGLIVKLLAVKFQFALLTEIMVDGSHDKNAINIHLLHL